MWTMGNQVVRQSVTFYLVQQLIHLSLVGINLVCTSMLALPVAEIALNASDLLGREGAEKLRILIGGGNIIVLAFE